MRHDAPHKNAQNHRNQSGNAIAIILIMIALLAALTAITMRSSSRSSSNMDTEQARIQGEKLMRTAQSYESGLQKLINANHCSENELSFLNTVTTRDYTNSAAPTDKHCELFDVEGAGLTYTNVDSGLLDSGKSAKSDYGQWIFTGTQCVLGIGSDDNDTCIDEELAILAIAPHITLATCLQINQLNGIANPSGAPPQDDIDEASGSTFKGSFSPSSGAEIGDSGTGTNLRTHATGCFEDSSGSWAGSYIFYHVIYAR